MTATTRAGHDPAPDGRRRTGPVARLLLAAVHAYQHLRAGRPSPCRYYPSCSAYAAEAVEVHGAGRGAWLALRRLGRCHPWGGEGIDLVPEPRGRRRAASAPSLLEKKAR